METLHSQFASCHNADEVNLHCRVSNTPAIKLYSGTFKYKCAEKVSAYYEDAEDAWLMNLKDLLKLEGDRASASEAIASVKISARKE